ncbi:MAG: hypothetical protein ACLQAT_12975 [Candidatus Binataceae bacterium]
MTGHPVWIADHDELDDYMIVASHAYHSHPGYLTDPICDDRGSYLPSLMLVPGIVFTRVLRLSPIYIGFVWRVMAGIGMAFTWYLIFRLYFPRRWLALWLTLFALFDTNSWNGRPLVEHAATFTRLFVGAGGDLLAHNPQITGSWRIIDPALSWPFLFFYIWLIGRAVKSGSQTDARWAGVGFGLCFTYFFAWTAIAGSLVLAMLFDGKRRRTYFTAGCIGALIGLLFLIPGAMLKREAVTDWPTRFDFFLPIGHFSEFLIPKTAFILAAIALVWVWRKDRDLLYLWCLCASALLLLNEQILTGLQLQNFHWYVVWGPTLWLLIVIATVRTVQSMPNWRRIGAVGGYVALAFTIATGTWMRFIETTRTAESVELTRDWNEFQPEFEQHRDVIQRGAVVAGAPIMVSFLTILNDNRLLSGYGVTLSSCVDNKEWNRRIAADAYFSGLDRETFARRQEAVLERYVWGAWARVPRLRSALLEERLAAFDEVAADPSAVAERFDLRYVVLPAAADDHHLKDDWISVVQGPYWQAWERKVSDRINSAGADR